MGLCQVTLFRSSLTVQSYAGQLIILNNRITAFSVYAHVNTYKFGKLVVNWSVENINSDVTKLNFDEMVRFALYY